MKKKTILTTLLGMFVVLSLGYAVYGEFARAKGVAPASAPDSGQERAMGEKPPEPVVYAYYLHGARRCITCRNIETGTQRALEREFPEPLASGALVYRPINVEEPANRHFISDFELTMSGVLLVERIGESVMRWDNLGRVWELAGRSEVLEEYVAGATRAFLSGS